MELFLKRAQLYSKPHIHHSSVLYCTEPVRAKYSPCLGVHLAGDEEDAPNECGVIILGVEPRPGQVERALTPGQYVAEYVEENN